MMSKKKIVGINYNNVNIETAAKEIYNLIQSRKGGYAVTPNAEIGEAYFKNEKLADSIDHADYVLPDGAGVVLASKICGNPLKERAAGYDVSRELLNYLDKFGNSLFLLGAKPGIAEKAANKILSEHKNIVIAGLHDGYFEKDSEVIDLLNNSKADVIFVALGFPRQEIFMRENRNIINGFMLGIGGSLDVYAGEVQRAPEFYIKHNIEWLFRLKSQPSRIGRMMKLPVYIFRAIFWKISGRAKKDKNNQEE